MINAYDKNIQDDILSSVIFVYETLKKQFPLHNLSINKLKVLLGRKKEESQTVLGDDDDGDTVKLNITEFLKDAQVLNKKSINLVI